MVEKIFRKFHSKFERSVQKTCGISKLTLRTFEHKNFRIIKSKSSRNHRDQYFEKILRKICKIFLKKLEDSPKNLEKPWLNLLSHN